MVSHQPQSQFHEVQESQSACCPHVVVVPQAAAVYFQSAHEPLVGPLEVPSVHWEVVAHQPHPPAAAQSAQPERLEHPVPPPHSVLYHFQVEQVPLDGPFDVPVWHAEVPWHHPQPLETVQPAQVVRAAHGSPEDPEQDVWYHAQSEQVPLDGPELPPVWHLLDALHQPHPERWVQASHAVDEAQGSVVPVWQEPSWHVRPEQQSAVVTHVCEPVRHWQVPATQLIHPQHSARLVHDLPASPQHSFAVGLSRQLMPLQHSLPAEHSLAATLHVDEVLQVPLWHDRPVAQGVPVVQHAWLAPPHCGAAHVPLAHVPAHTLLHWPQLRASDLVSTHVLLQHEPAVHAVPVVQHDWLRAPHAAVVLHTPAWHVRPALQTLPVQHGWVASPHCGAVAQVPFVHTSPDAQALPLQHGSRSAPQLTGAAQLPPWHTSPELHTFPVQQGCEALPHPVLVMHAPSAQ